MLVTREETTAASKGKGKPPNHRAQWWMLGIQVSKLETRNRQRTKSLDRLVGRGLTEPWRQADRKSKGFCDLLDLEW